MRNKYLLGLAIILLSLICIDFYIKITCSSTSLSGKKYIDLYESRNLYRLKNIYLITFLNIILGGISIFLFLRFKNFFFSKVVLYILVTIAFLLTFMNLFSLL